MSTEINPSDRPSETGDIDRPVRRYTLIIGGLFILFTFIVCLQFLWFEGPDDPPSDAEQPDSTAPADP